MKVINLANAIRLMREREIDCQDYSEKQKFSLFVMIIKTDYGYERSLSNVSN